MKLAKADIVPKDTNLLPQYDSFAAIEGACEAFMDTVNMREHRATKRKPAVMLEEERLRLHPIPDTAHTVAFGLSRRVPDNTPMVTFENGQYSVPAYLLGAKVFVRTHGAGPDEQIVIVYLAADGPREVARHGRARPGSPAIIDAHFPDHKAKHPGDYVIVPKSKAEAEFLAIGEGAKSWLLEAASVGVNRITMKMAEAVTLAKMAGRSQVDAALGTAAIHHRFAHGDLASILNAAGSQVVTHSAAEDKSLAQGTGGWAAIGRSAAAELEESA